MVEGDASSASYFLGGAAITGGRVRVQGCGLSSIQGDVQFATVLEKMGAKVCAAVTRNFFNPIPRPILNH